MSSTIEHMSNERLAVAIEEVREMAQPSSERFPTMGAQQVIRSAQRLLPQLEQEQARRVQQQEVTE